MTCSLIITTYNWEKALELSILSAIRQTVAPDEIIIADDGSNIKTKILIETIRRKTNITIVHSWQEDKGFRASISRNKAIAIAKNEYIILIDGDIILHKDFIKDHKKNAKNDYFIQGGRVLLNKQKSKKILEYKDIDFSFFDIGLENRKNTLRSSFLSNIFSKNTISLKGIKTCNMSFYKEDCLKTNGFNEDFLGWGREDSEFAVRLINSGIHRQNIKFNAIAYHIFHNENTRDNLLRNDKLLEDSIRKNLKWCKNGINKYKG